MHNCIANMQEGDAEVFKYIEISHLSYNGCFVLMQHLRSGGFNPLRTDVIVLTHRIFFGERGNMNDR